MLVDDVVIPYIENEPTNETITIGHIIARSILGELRLHDPDYDKPLEWFVFFYSGKPRFALNLGDDPRLGEDYYLMLTHEGLRTFKKDKIFSLTEVTDTINSM